MIDLSIITVSYNGREFLKKCLLSILQNISEAIKYEIIVVDNASTDGTVESIEHYVSSSKYKNVKIIANKENVGFSKANNQGIKASGESRYVLFLNPDTVVQKKTIETMLEFMQKHTDAGAATCKLIVPNGGIDDASHRGFPTPWNSFCYFSRLSRLFPNSKFFNGYNLGWMDMSKIHEIDALAGAFMLVRREAGKMVGWWDEDYFFYGEDIDFCYRLKEKGWRIYYIPTVFTLHYNGVSSGIKKISRLISKATKETKILATKHRFNAMKIFYKKHYEKKYPKLITWFIYGAIYIKERLALLSI